MLGGKHLKLVERDYLVLKMIYRFGFCLGRHVCFLAHFPSARTCDRRLKILIDNGYIERKKFIFGIPYLYYLTPMGKKLIHATPVKEKIRIDNILHQVFLLDHLPMLIDKYHFSLDNIQTERELHSLDSFGTRNHRPDLVFLLDDKKVAIEFERSKKAKNRLKTNIESNYLDYDRQIWIVPSTQAKVISWITEEINNYLGIEVVVVDD